MQRRRTQGGAVTAETAMVLPLIAIFAISMVWVVSLGLTQVRAIDAARETARAAARSEPDAEARALGARVAPVGSRISLGRSDGTVTARVSSPVSGPRGLFGAWARVRVHAEAVAVEEPR